jgi:hypothetical protein
MIMLFENLLDADCANQLMTQIELLAGKNTKKDFTPRDRQIGAIRVSWFS